MANCEDGDRMWRAVVVVVVVVVVGSGLVTGYGQREEEVKNFQVVKE